MGFRVQLIAIQGKRPTVIHDEYGVTPNGHREEAPDSPVTGTVLPNDMYLLYINDQIIPDDHVFRRLSKNASLIACYANETVMNSYVCSWINGTKMWSVFHDAQEDIRHLETSGNPPQELQAIQDHLFAEQDADPDPPDYIFDIPIDLFVALGGIRYDHLNVSGSEPWEVLQRR
jgi:hypothetical protein